MFKQILVLFILLLLATPLFAEVGDSENVELVGSIYNKWDSSRDIKIAGSYAYVADNSSGLRVLDISSPSSPVEVGHYITNGGATDVTLSGNFAFVATGFDGIRILDISDPTAITQIGHYDTNGAANGIAISGNYAIVSDFSEGMRVLDISDLALPVEVGFYDVGSFAFDVEVIGNYAYLANGSYGLRIIDISTPATPIEVGIFDNFDDAYNLAIDGDYAYVCYGDAGLRVIDISDPTTPASVDLWDTFVFVYNVSVAGSYAYVSGYEYGVRILDISNPSSVNEAGNYDPADADEANSVAINGNTAFVAYGIDGLNVLNVSDHTDPTLIGSYDTDGVSYGVAVSGDYAYVADDAAGLRIVDISDPSAMNEVAHFDTDGRAWDVDVYGDYAYIADDEFGLRIVNVSNPAAPVGTSTFDTAGKVYGVDVLGNWAYVADFNAGLRVINILDPASPSETGFLDTGGYSRDVVVVGEYAYVADMHTGLRIIQITNRAVPVEVGFYDTIGSAYGVAVSGDYAYVADYDRGLRIIDVSDPTAPSETGFYTAPDEGNYHFDAGRDARGVTVSGDYAYVAYGAAGLRVIDISDPANPSEVGFYFSDGLASDVAMSGDNILIADTYHVQLLGFYLVILPDPFDLLSPLNEAVITTSEVELSWSNSSPDVYEFDLFFATDSLFTENADSMVIMDDHQVLTDLVDNTTYWWKLRANNDTSEGRWSNQTWSFTVDIEDLPLPFDLVAPTDGTVLDELINTFEWNETTDPDPDDMVMYMLSISTDEAFTDPLLYGAGIDSEYPVNDLVDDTNYWWKVLAADSETTGTWSNETWTFSTFVPEIQSDFSLIEPEDDAVIGGDVDFEFTASWEESIDPDPGENVTYDFVGIVSLPSGTDTTLRYSSGEEASLTLNIPDSLGLEFWESEMSVDWFIESISGLDTVASQEEFSLTLAINSDVDDNLSNLPEIFEITSLYPNPFNPTLTAVVGLPEASNLTVKVYNVLGQSVATLSNGGQYSAGYHNFIFNANEVTSRSSGVYFVHAIVPGKLNQVQKIVLMK